MAFNDSPLPRTQRSLDERRATAQREMRRAAWLAYFVAVLNAVAGYMFAEQARSVGRSLVPVGVGMALAGCGYALTRFHSRAAAAGLLLGTVAITIARWMSMGRPGPVIPGLVALYVFWQGFEAASEWNRLRDYVVPTEEAARRAV
jgi:hypothetical protein